MMRAFGVCQDYQRYVLMRRIYSNRQVLELMTEFWENHLNVPLNGEPCYLFRRAYGETLRAQAFGRYEDILFAAVTHPAMLVYLDNSNSTAEHPNENLGRELLELHSVGIGAYNEDHVKDAAADPHRLAGRHPAGQQEPDVGRVVHPRRPLGRPRERHGLHRRERRPRRPRPDPALRRLPRAPPADRPPDRDQAGPEVRPRRRAAGPRGPPRAGLPRQRHRHRPVLRALVASPEFAGSARRQGARRHGGRGRHLARPGRPGPQAHRPRVRREHPAVAGRQPRPDAVHVAAARRRPAGQRPVVHARRG